MTRTPGLDANRLERVLAAQYHVISAEQARFCGLTRKALEYRLRPDGPWRRLLPSIFVAMTGPVTQEHREMATLLYAGPDAVLTGAAAARRHGLSCAGWTMVDVLVPLNVRRQNVGFARRHRTARLPEKRYVTGPLRLAAPTRAVADAVRGMDNFRDVQALVCQAVQRNRCTIEDLAAELTDGPPARSRLLRMALAEVSDGVRSVAEADFRKLILRSGLPKPMFNARLHDADGVFIAMVDAWWQEAGVAVEIDSRAYHLSAADADRTTARHDKLITHGILPLHFPPKRLKTDEPGIIEEIRRALEKGMCRPALKINATPAAA